MTHRLISCVEHVYPVPVLVRPRLPLIRLRRASPVPSTNSSINIKCWRWSVTRVIRKSNRTLQGFPSGCKWRFSFPKSDFTLPGRVKCGVSESRALLRLFVSERHSGTPSLSWWIFKHYRVRHSGEVFGNKKRDVRGTNRLVIRDQLVKTDIWPEHQT